MLRQFARAAVGECSSIGESGLLADVGGAAAQSRSYGDVTDKDGPELPLVDPAQCCGAARGSGHSCSAQHFHSASGGSAGPFCRSPRVLSFRRDREGNQ